MKVKYFHKINWILYLFVVVVVVFSIFLLLLPYITIFREALLLIDFFLSNGENLIWTMDAGGRGGAAAS